MKLTELKVHEAYTRAIYGESVNSIARSMSVTEGALRWRFRGMNHPREVRRAAWQHFEAMQALEAMPPAMRAKVERMAKRLEADRLSFSKSPI
jgi:hypothetical protein